MKHQLEQALYEVHPKIFTKIAETVAGDEPIAVGNWMYIGATVQCGCLATNGYVSAQENPYALWGLHFNLDALNALLHWYGVASSEVSRRKLGNVALQFDRWCVERQLGGYIPGSDGDLSRRELRELVAGVAAERKAWTS